MCELYHTICVAQTRLCGQRAWIQSDITELNNLGLQHLCFLFGKMATVVPGHTLQNESMTIVRDKKCERYLVICKGGCLILARGCW